MPKIANFGVDANEAAKQELGDTQYYDGPVPPKGVYKVNVKRLSVKKNSKGAWMFNAVCEINETKKDKKQYNGYGIWFNQNITKQGAPWVNSFLRGIGLTEAQIKSFWGKVGLRTEEGSDGPAKVLSIGGFKIKEEIPALVLTKRGSYNGEPKLEIVQFLTKSDDAAEDDAEEREDDGDDEDATDDDTDADDADDDDDDDDEDEDDEDDDGDEPPF